MIYWFTGQPSSGKTTLAKLLRNHLINGGVEKNNIKLIDGDSLRLLFSNTDYSTKGRFNNVKMAQNIAYYLHNENYTVIVSLVSPYLDQRENFKLLLNGSLIEIYLECSEAREKDCFKVHDYQKPVKNYIHINTQKHTKEDALKKILLKIT